MLSNRVGLAQDRPRDCQFYSFTTNLYECEIWAIQSSLSCLIILYASGVCVVAEFCSPKCSVPLGILC